MLALCGTACSAPDTLSEVRVCAWPVPARPPPLRDSEWGPPGASAEIRSQPSRLWRRASPEAAWSRVAGAPAPASLVDVAGRACGEAGDVAVLGTEPPGQRAVCRALCQCPAWKVARPSRWPGRDAVSSRPPYRWGTWASGPVRTASERGAGSHAGVGRRLAGLVVPPCCSHVGWPRVLTPMGFCEGFPHPAIP